jgi:hypothetical protein
MKKELITLCAIVATVIFTSCAQKTIIPNTELPAEIKTYLATNFPNQSLSQAMKDRDDLTVKYEIILGDLTKLEFNRAKEITEIKGKNKLPNSVISDNILTYTNMNYPNNFIVAWKIDDRKQEIKLDNGLDLKFTSAGDFIRIDK